MVADHHDLLVGIELPQLLLKLAHRQQSGTIKVADVVFPGLAHIEQQWLAAFEVGS